MRKRATKKLLSILCNLLVLLAPATLNSTASALFWGEPECPDVLKASVSSK